MMDEMIGNAEEFYQSLGIPYRVVNIVSGRGIARELEELEGEGDEKGGRNLLLLQMFHLSYILMFLEHKNMVGKGDG